MASNAPPSHGHPHEAPERGGRRYPTVLIRLRTFYVFGNRHRMRYPQFRAQGLCISSGVVEAGCKQIGARLKRAGMRWTVAGAKAIIALRCCILSGRFEDFWERRATNAA